MNLDALIPSDFSGVISVRQNDVVLYRKTYGYADLPNKILNEVDTRFATASAGKAFVASGILKLIEQQKLTLDSCIGDILDFDLNQIDPKITVKQLLNHTSGIPDYCDESIVTNYADLFIDYPCYKIRTSMDLLPFFIDKPMMYPRGEKFQYNNTGYAVLGLVIEKITGLPFDKYLDTEVFAACGMKNTGYYELDRLPAKCANAYIFDEVNQEYYTNIYSVDAKGTGAGGAFTTVIDVEKFWDGLNGGKIISKSMLALMQSPQVDEQSYGYGLWMQKLPNGKLLPYFQGYDPGVSFKSSYDLDKHISITLISNFGQNVWSLHDSIIKEMV
jgi:CubicO group peptidase (beta-lactamase class C family)